MSVAVQVGRTVAKPGAQVNEIFGLKLPIIRIGLAGNYRHV